ncbi:carboxylesterase/lipase family protein [Maribacter hydrothermalis]|uniref:Carboxylic ester hydrolase n=1 Tax=Maribacter hydrothermalis TaxID=1836467 RepID=A0A1B7YXQ1_9FLAO|nr:carboxylesterase family protein [Maribacter hydrothermalis]APQ16821.1 carboxylesterase [Maribacter hydrothermalis]OBR35249.1 carboxylesterase [Maribacter hydrothermalis]
MKNFISLMALMVVIILNTNVSAQDVVLTGTQVPATNTEFGQIRGYIHNNITTYKGIPYAQAKRFETAQSPTKWEGVKSTTMYGPVAPLVNPTISIQDESEFVFDHDWGFPNEDCLSLNVWTPEASTAKKRPVLFWIHGGGFTTGSSHELPSYDGENLAKKGDVVVVSINHRLNVLGFLDLSAYGEKYKHSANNSILDMVKALEWVKNNIENFGGDPNNVTIFGQSGGGAKVTTLMSMPKAKGLFHKAINQSGSFRTAMLEKEDTQAIASETLNILGLNDTNVDEIQNIPFEKLAEASSKALAVVAEKMKAAGKPVIGFGLNWGPSRDGIDLPYQLSSPQALALSKDIPLMLGTAKNEFAPFANMRFIGASEETIMKHIQDTYKDKADDYVNAVKKAYPNDTDPKDLLDVDTMFRPGAVMQANEKSALAGGAPVFMYLFTWQSPVFDGKYKALHCMELPFVFDNINLANHMTGGGKEAHDLAEKMSGAWLNFAKTGNPNYKNLPEWPSYTCKNTATMHFNNKCEVKPQLDKELFELVSQAPD